MKGEGRGAVTTAHSRLQEAGEMQEFRVVRRGIWGRDEFSPGCGGLGASQGTLETLGMGSGFAHRSP